MVGFVLRTVLAVQRLARLRCRVSITQRTAR